MDEGLRLVSYYIALIHKEPGSGYGVSFPDVPGVTTAGETLAEAMEQAADVLAFAAEDWAALTDRPFPDPRRIDEIRADPAWAEEIAGAIVAAVPAKPIARAA